MSRLETGIRHRDVTKEKHERSDVTSERRIDFDRSIAICGGQRMLMLLTAAFRRDLAYRVTILSMCEKPFHLNLADYTAIPSMCETAFRRDLAYRVTILSMCEIAAQRDPGVMLSRNIT